MNNFKSYVNKLLLDKNKKEILSKSLLFMLFRVFAVILAYIFVLTIIKLYGENIYGYVTLGFTIMTITSVLATLGFDLSLTKFFAEEGSITKHTSKYYTSILISFTLSIFLAFIYYYFSDFIAGTIFNKPEFSPYLRWTALTIPVWTLLNISASVFWGLKKIIYYSIFNTFGRFLLTLIILVIAYYGYEFRNSDYTPMAAHFLGVFVLLCVSVAILATKLQKPKIRLDKDFKGFFKNSSSILLSSILIIFLIWMDKLFLGVYVDAKEIGYYDVAARIATLIVFSLEAINSILTPKISHAYSENNLKKMQDDINFISKVNIIISILAFLFLLVFNEYLFNFFGENYNIARNVLIILCVAQLINSFTGPVWNIMQMTGLQNILSKILVVTIVINIILNLLLVKPFGINGAAFATAVSMIFWNSLCCIYIYRKLGIRTFYIPKLILK